MRRISRTLTLRPALAGAAGLAVALGAVGASPAHADIYWTTILSVGQAADDGSSPDPGFIRRALAPTSVAANSKHIYWTNQYQTKQSGKTIGTIGRSRIDGKRADPLLIPGLGKLNGVAARRTHIYWADGSGKIGRASTTGRDVLPSFIPGLENPTAVASKGRHIYWIDEQGIGRARTNGSQVESGFIPFNGADNISSLAVTRTHIYWVVPNSSEIARAKIDGSGVDEEFITGITGVPTGLAVGAGHLYWSVPAPLKPVNRSIGRALLNGSSVQMNLVPSANLVAGGADDMMTFGLAYVKTAQ